MDVHGSGPDLGHLAYTYTTGKFVICFPSPYGSMTFCRKLRVRMKSRFSHQKVSQFSEIILHKGPLLSGIILVLLLVALMKESLLTCCGLNNSSSIEFSQIEHPTDEHTRDSQNARSKDHGQQIRNQEYERVKDQASDVHAGKDDHLNTKKVGSETDGRTNSPPQRDSNLEEKGPNYSVDIQERKKQQGMPESFKKTCDNIGPTKQLSGRNYTVNFVTDPEHKVLFCEIFKCASTFWKGILNEKVRKAAPVENGAVNSWFRFMFVREPYRRFLSFYVDKLYTPNPEFWRMFSEWIPRCRNSKTKRKGCCEDVTFTELLEFVVREVEKGNPLDPHLTPMHEHCHPCQNPYDFVGRMENFTNDASHVFNELNSRTHSDISFSDFQKESKTFAVKDYVHRLFRHKVWINRCLPMYDSMLRTWKALQIRGILDSRAKLPFSRPEAEHVSRSSFMAAALRAMDMSTDPARIRKAKSEAVIEAFSSVPRDLLLKIKNLVKPDCLLFGYDLEPSEIFGHDRHKKSQTKYFVSLDEKEYRKYFGGDPSKLPSARLKALSGMMPV